MIKIDIISGFLGAGKTTLIQKLFESSLKNEMVVLIENEFGEIGIDSSFLKSSGIEIKEINAGCICCSLVGDFSSSIDELISRYHPDRIIIEPSGVGKLSDIIRAINDTHHDELSLNILTTVVDGPKAKMHLRNFGEFFLNQVESASTIVISKTEKMLTMQLEEVIHQIHHINPNANIISTSLNELSADSLLNTLEATSSLQKDFEKELLEEVKHHHDEECHCHEHHHDEECHCHEHHHDEECHCHEHHHDEECHCHEHHHDEECHCHEHHHDEECHCHEHHHADEIFTSWGIETPKSISYQNLVSFLEALKNDESLGIILRSKGILKASDNDSWYYFDFVSGDYEIREGDPEAVGRIVVIGSKMNSHKIEELFKSI